MLITKTFGWIVFIYIPAREGYFSNVEEPRLTTLYTTLKLALVAFSNQAWQDTAGLLVCEENKESIVFRSNESYYSIRQSINSPLKVSASRYDIILKDAIDMIAVLPLCPQVSNRLKQNISQYPITHHMPQPRNTVSLRKQTHARERSTAAPFAPRVWGPGSTAVDVTRAAAVPQLETVLEPERHRGLPDTGFVLSTFAGVIAKAALPSTAVRHPYCAAFGGPRSSVALNGRPHDENRHRRPSRRQRRDGSGGVAGSGG